MAKINIPSFEGGINEYVDKHLLKTNEAASAQNCDIQNGALSRSKGSTQYATASLLNPIESLMAYYPNGTGILLVASGGKIYKLVNDVFTEISSIVYSSNKFDYVNFQILENDIIVFGNGVDNTKVYDGTTVRDLKHDGRDSVASSTNKAPKGKYMELHYERLWIAGDSENPNRVYFSTANVNGFDPDDWTYPVTEGEANQHGGFIEVPTWDGGVIIGLKVIFNDVLIFKNHNIFRIFGTYPGNYTKDQVYSTEGAIADKSIAVTNNKAFFVSTDGIFTYDGTNVFKISDKLNETWKTLNKDALINSVAICKDSKYILAVPEGTSTVNNLIIEYDNTTGSFMLKRGKTVNSFVDFKDKILYTDESGKIFEYESGDMNNGNIIDSFWESGITDQGFPNSIKYSDYLYFTGSGNGDVRFVFKTERGSKEKVVTLTTDEILYKVKLKNKGRQLSLRIENINGSNYKIVSPTLMVEYDLD